MKKGLSFQQRKLDIHVQNFNPYLTTYTTTPQIKRDPTPKYKMQNFKIPRRKQEKIFVTTG